MHDSDVEVTILQQKDEDHDHVQLLVIEPESHRTDPTEQMDDLEMMWSENLISPATFCRAFPFHLMFDKDLSIYQAGTSVSRVLPQINEANCKVRKN